MPFMPAYGPVDGPVWQKGPQGPLFPRVFLRVSR